MEASERRREWLAGAFMRGRRSISAAARATLLPAMLVAALLRHVLDFCYPGACASCEEPADGGALLCASCAGHLEDLSRAGACARCAMPLSAPDAPCPYCH